MIKKHLYIAMLMLSLISTMSLKAYLVELKRTYCDRSHEANRITYRIQNSSGEESEEVVIFLNNQATIDVPDGNKIILKCLDSKLTLSPRDEGYKVCRYTTETGRLVNRWATYPRY